MAQSRGHMLIIGLYREIINTHFLSETARSRALIFGIGPLPGLLKLWP